ncbi:hypothetical protein QTO34_004019 [Cnephaeus nilssonii]|uniref:Uncharacterized protein n=1 Tax=Cnephaeus nilssonii TaxID=3371016 RepID=A0AA40HSJ7_CNENI|nr:hypothetical protein QTO34_004019 [Eptesicus nilssonii]
MTLKHGVTHLASLVECTDLLHLYERVPRPGHLRLGHSFCHPCLCLSWDVAQTPMHCPHCRQVSEKPDFKTSIPLRSLASLARQARADSVNSSEEQICVALKQQRGSSVNLKRTCSVGSALIPWTMWLTATAHHNGLLRNTGQTAGSYSSNSTAWTSILVLLNVVFFYCPFPNNLKNMDRILQVFQNELTCSICRNYFVDPITIDCGHSFCRPCFYLSLQNRSVLARCSECQKEIQQRDFHTNVTLKQMVLIVRQARLWNFLRSKENRCGIHMEAKQVFCEDQRSLLCLHCSTSQEHGAHRHCSVEEAAEQHREKLLKTMCSLWQKCCENDRNLIVESVTTRSWEIYVTSKGEAIRAEYDALAPIYHLEKHQHLERLQREGKGDF